MQVDRRATKVLNSLCAIVALSAVGLLGWIAYVRHDVSRPHRAPERHAGLREARRRAVLAERRGDEVEAERQYRTASLLVPWSDEIRAGLARACLAAGKREEAWDLYRAILAQPLARGIARAGESDGLAWYAELANERGNTQGADRAISIVLRRSERDLAYSRTRRLALAHLDGAGDVISAPAVALLHAQRAVQLDPTSVYAHLCLAKALGDLQRTQESQTSLAEARRLAATGGGEGWITMARYEGAHNHPDRMKVALDEAAHRTAKGDGVGWLSLAEAADALHEKPQAILCLRRAYRAIRADDGPALLRLAEGYSQIAKDPTDANIAAERARRALPPRQANLSGRVAIELSEVGDKSQAIEVLRAAMPYASATDRAWLDNWLALLEGRARKMGFSGFGGVASVPYGFRT